MTLDLDRERRHSRRGYKLYARPLPEHIPQGMTTWKFKREFPGGEVPVNETRHLIPGATVFDSLMNTLTVFEHEKERDRRAEAARTGWEKRRDRTNYGPRSQSAAWRRHVRSVLAHPGPLADVMETFKLTNNDIASAISWRQRGAPWLQLDDMYQDGCSERMIAKTLGMDPRTVRAYIGVREAA